MRRYLLAASLVFAPLTAFADAVEDVIRGQLEAFAERDILSAFEHASPVIQNRFFGDPRAFGSMVEMGYSSIWNNADARFSTRMETGGRVRQTVVITDQSGALHAFEYDMVDTPNGWKINGVRPVALPDAAV